MVDPLDCVDLRWPEEADELDKLPLDTDYAVVFVLVSTPRDQALLHRKLGRMGYCPVFQHAEDGKELWRFHHPDGPKP